MKAIFNFLPSQEFLNLPFPRFYASSFVCFECSYCKCISQTKQIGPVLRSLSWNDYCEDLCCAFFLIQLWRHPCTMKIFYQVYFWSTFGLWLKKLQYNYNFIVYSSSKLVRYSLSFYTILMRPYSYISCRPTTVPCTSSAASGASDLPSPSISSTTRSPEPAAHLTVTLTRWKCVPVLIELALCGSPSLFLQSFIWRAHKNYPLRTPLPLISARWF